MTSALKALIEVKDAQRAELSELVEQFLSKQQVEEVPIQARPMVARNWRDQHNHIREEADAKRLKDLADKHCRQPRGVSRPGPRPEVRNTDTRKAHEAKSAARRAERQRIAPLIASMVANGCPTSEICDSLGKSRALITRAAAEASIQLNRSPGARRKD